jgi:hypothetical protein
MSQSLDCECRNIQGKNLNKILTIFEGLEERDKEEAPIMFNEINSVIN